MDTNNLLNDSQRTDTEMLHMKTDSSFTQYLWSVNYSQPLSLLI